MNSNNNKQVLPSTTVLPHPMTAQTCPGSNLDSVEVNKQAGCTALFVRAGYLKENIIANMDSSNLSLLGYFTVNLIMMMLQFPAVAGVVVRAFALQSGDLCSISC